MSFKLFTLAVNPDGRLLVTLKKASNDTQTSIWITPGQPVENLTIAQIEEMARREAAKQHAC